MFTNSTHINNSDLLSTLVFYTFLFVVLYSRLQKVHIHNLHQIRRKTNKESKHVCSESLPKKIDRNSLVSRRDFVLENSKNKDHCATQDFNYSPQVVCVCVTVILEISKTTTIPEVLRTQHSKKQMNNK